MLARLRFIDKQSARSFSCASPIQLCNVEQLDAILPLCERWTHARIGACAASWKHGLLSFAPSAHAVTAAGPNADTTQPATSN